MGEKEVKNDGGISLEQERIPDLEFATDAVIFSETLEVLLDTLTMESEPLIQKFPWIKTEI